MIDDKIDIDNKADVSNYIDLFLSPGNMNISLKRDHFDEAKITGSPTQDEFEELEKIEEPVIKAMLASYPKEFDATGGGDTPKNHAAVLAASKSVDNCEQKRTR